MMYRGALHRVHVPALSIKQNAGISLKWLVANALSRNFASQRSLHEDLTKFMHGRGNRERRDSVTNEILWERQQHLKRLCRLPANPAIVRTLEDEGLGSRRRKHQVYAHITVHQPGVIRKKTNSGAGTNVSNLLASFLSSLLASPFLAGGFALHLTSTSRDWPIFKHLLPEIAFAGHSNSGKVKFSASVSVAARSS